MKAQSPCELSKPWCLLSGKHIYDGMFPFGHVDS